MQHRLAALTSILVACGGCDGGGDAVDAPITVDIDNGSCGSELRFTGEYIDWDSSDATFCGIFDAAFEVPNGAMDTTAPNGRFDMCISGTDDVTLVDITPSATNSQCASPMSPYPLAGIAVANAAMLRAGGFWSGRNFTAARQASLGVTLDPAKAQVFVHVDGPPRTIALAAAHGEAQTFDGTTWVAGDTGTDLFFPNVDVGTTALSATGGQTIGTGEIPLVANKLTSVALKAF